VVDCDFNFVGIPVLPLEADPELIVDANAVLSGAVAFQAFEAIARRHAQLAELSHPIELSEVEETPLVNAEVELQANHKKVAASGASSHHPTERLAWQLQRNVMRQGAGISRSRQILRARKSFTSRCRGTVETLRDSVFT
jgi:hypothetical protein